MAAGQQWTRLHNRWAILPFAGGAGAGTATIRLGDSLYGCGCPAANPRKHEMAMREARTTEFSQGIPKQNRPLQILREDQRGTYIIPYLYQWSDGAWRKIGSAKTN